jgi:hypothetical protein
MLAHTEGRRSVTRVHAEVNFSNANSDKKIFLKIFNPKFEIQWYGLTHKIFFFRRNN